MKPQTPLWVRDDRASQGEEIVTSHAVAKNLKQYGKMAVSVQLRIHRTRHTHAWIVAADSGSIVHMQAALGHADRKTTEIYVERFGVQKDEYSRYVSARLHPQQG